MAELWKNKEGFGAKKGQLSFASGSKNTRLGEFHLCFYV